MESNVITQTAEALNIATAEARADQRVTQPTQPATTGKVPTLAWVDYSPTVARFVADIARIEAQRDKLGLKAADIADAFVVASHPALPEYDDYRIMQTYIKAAAIAAGYAEMTFIKAYRNALTRTFGALPVSQSPEAIKKAAQRAKKAEAEKAANPETPERGAVQEKAVQPHEIIGQMIATYGPAAVLIELSKILATEKATVQDAHTLIEVARHYAK